MSKVIDAITEAIKLADRVETLSEKVSEMARASRDDSKDLQFQIHELDKRLVRIESLIEFSQKQKNLEHQD